MTQFVFVALMLTGTLFLSWNDIQRKRYLNQGINDSHLLVVSFIIGGLILCIPLFYFGIPRILPAFWLAAMVSTSLGTISQQLYFRAYSLSEASLVAPLRLITPPLVILTGFLVLGEKPTLVGSLGIFVTVLGLWFLLFPNMRPSLHLEKGALYGLAACTLFALEFPFGKLMIVSSSALFVSATLLPAVGVLTLLWCQLLDRTFTKRLLMAAGRTPIQFLALSATFSIGVLLTNQALNYSLTAYAASLKRLQAVWTVFFSGRLLREKDTIKRLLAALTMFVGIILSVVFQ